MLRSDDKYQLCSAPSAMVAHEERTKPEARLIFSASVLNIYIIISDSQYRDKEDDKPNVDKLVFGFKEPSARPANPVPMLSKCARG